MAGLFITFEGGEGSGKSTQIQLLYKYLVGKQVKCKVTREPGGSPESEVIRELLLTGAGDKWSPVSETLLFQAARVEHVERVIKPALQCGEVVLCDRFLDSTIVYQGVSKGLGIEYVSQLHQLTLGNFQPDLTLVLDIDPRVGVERAKSRRGKEMRFENMDMKFHDTVRNGFLSLAEKNSARYKVINASKSVDSVHKSITASLVSLAVF